MEVLNTYQIYYTKAKGPITPQPLQDLELYFVEYLFN